MRNDTDFKENKIFETKQNYSPFKTKGKNTTRKEKRHRPKIYKHKKKKKNPHRNEYTEKTTPITKRHRQKTIKSTKVS